MRGNGESGLAAWQEMQETSLNMNWGVCPVPLQIDYENALEGGYNDYMPAVEAEDKSLLTKPAYRATYDTIMREKENPKADVWNWQEAFIRTEGTKAAIYEKNLVQPVLFYGTTDTMTTRWANLEKLETETMVKIITGDEPVDYFDEFVDTWLSMGGEDITNEVQAELDAR